MLGKLFIYLSLISLKFLFQFLLTASCMPRSHCCRRCMVATLLLLFVLLTRSANGKWTLDTRSDQSFIAFDDVVVVIIVVFVVVYTTHSPAPCYLTPSIRA